MPRTSTLMKEHKKAIECLECPERWSRPINGNGHFRSVVTSLSVTWQDYGILGHSVPKLTLALLISLIHATHFHTHAETQPERWPRPMNVYGHFRERCDVIKRHLARLWNFGTLRPKINPCPIDQPHPCHALAETQKSNGMS